MAEAQLEDTLLAFIHGDYDLLVTTTIIETGVDISNANTLFIENADRFGLSQLYQLRGRVGRTNRIAYAYFMYRPDKILSEVSEKRLDAIKGFTELGSGFKIAMRDLSIRGAGNLLGSEQSGFIETIGFDLYSQLLEEAVQQRMGQTQQAHSNAEINLSLDAFIPETYIADERQKIEIYKRIRQIDGQEAYDVLSEELVDRFGEYPDEVAYLLEIGRLKHFADAAFVESFDKSQREIVVKLEKTSRAIYEAQDYFEALGETKLEVNLAEEHEQMLFRFKLQHNAAFWLGEMTRFVEKLAEIRERKEDVSRETSKFSTKAEEAETKTPYA
jgi:transcription-repair coupling factor (superfamily II helicase)